jgi:hypothetical protein
MATESLLRCPPSPTSETTSIVGLRDDHHTAAISLNNSAVLLLERGECWSAMETFRDAIFLMERAVVHRRNPNHDDDENIRMALSRASERTSCCHEPDTITSIENQEQRPVLTVISSQSNPSTILRMLHSISDTTSLHAAFPVTIDPISSDFCSLNDVSFDSGIVLYNYGIALDCASVLPPEYPDTMDFPQEILRVKAHAVFQNTYLVLFEIDRYCNGHMSICLATSILLLRTVLTHSLINLAIKLHLGPEYDNYCHIMERLLLLIETQQLLLPVDDRSVASAA